MSYNILYRAFALKNDKNEYLVFTETGDNNVREGFTNKVTRDWALSPMIHGGKLEFLPEQCIKDIISEVNFEDGSYATYGKRKREFAPYWAIIKRAIKNAIPLENCTDYATFAVYSFDKGEYRTMLTTLTECEIKVAFTCEKDLMGENGYLVCSRVNYNAIYPKRQRATNPNPIPKKFAVRLIQSGGYFKRRTTRRIKYAFYPTKFTEKRANEIAKFLNENAIACKIIKID
jgi:hypothetical protein